MYLHLGDFNNFCFNTNPLHFRALQGDMVHHHLRGEVIMGLHNSQVWEEDCQDQGLGDNLHPQEDSVAGVKTSDNLSLVN